MTAGLNGPPGNPDINPYAIPEFFGDVICVNGKSWPYLEVEPRRYRFRLLNASNARMYALFLDVNGMRQCQTMWQIGTDGGLLDAPVNIKSFVPCTYNPSNVCSPQNLGPVFTTPRLFLAPAEQSGYHHRLFRLQGKYFTLNNDSPAPISKWRHCVRPDVEGRRHAVQGHKAPFFARYKL